MDAQKATSQSNSSPKQAQAGRRSFIRKTGAALSAVIASAVAGTSKPKVDQDASLKEQLNRLSNQLGVLEDANAIRKLHQAYEDYLDQGMYEEVVSLFADDGEVFFNGGIFIGKEKGIRRLYLDHFAQGFTGRKVEPARDIQLDPVQRQEVVGVAPDRKSANARFLYSMQVGVPIVSESQLIQMARLQGQGIRKWSEGGIDEGSYVREGDRWKIKRLDYHVLWQADYAPGLPYSKPISVPLFSRAYPENPTGPDKLIAPAPGNA